MSEQVPDEDTWPSEARAAIKDINKHVVTATISENLPNTNQRIYMNMTTLEKKHYCVELSATGFKIVGNGYDDTSLIKTGTTYETPYAMLNSISEGYRKSFGGELMKRLLDLAKEEEDDD